MRTDIVILAISVAVTSCWAIAGVPHAVSVYSNCSESDMMAGFQVNIADYNAIRRTIFPNFSYDQLEKLCLAFPGAQENALLYLALCNDTIEAEKYLSFDVDGFVHAWEFVCDNQNLYAANKKCFENETLVAESKKCDEDLYEHTWFLNFKEPFKPEKHRERCLAWKDYITCGEAKIKEYCNADAAAWQYEIHMKLNEPYFEDIDCKMGVSLSTGAMAIIGICAAAGVFVIIMVIIAFTRSHLQKKKQPQTEPDDAKKKLADNKEKEKENGRVLFTVGEEA